MVHIVKKIGNKGNPSFYIYENNYDSGNKKYKKKYLGKATEQQYLKYVQQLEVKRKKLKTCAICKKRYAHTIPKYLLDSFEICQCGKNVQQKVKKNAI